MRNELGRVLSLVEDYRTSGETRARFAQRRRLHPSAFSRLLRVAELPGEVLEEVGRLPRLSRTHLEVLATAPPERRAAIVEGIKTGSSTYRLRERRETTAVALTSSSSAPEPVTTTSASTACGPATATSPAQTSPTPTSPTQTSPIAFERPEIAAIAQKLGASPEEMAAFASELLLVLWRSGRGRVEESFRAFKGLV